MVARSMLVFASVFVVVLGFAEANVFRGNLRPSITSSTSTEQIRATVLKEVAAALGSENRVTEKRLADIEALLLPIFNAMPKNKQGNLDDAAARYVLHRLFVQRHAMFIKGLEPGKGGSLNMSVTEVVGEHVPSFVLSLFEAQRQDKGLSMHELAVLAATLEHLIHDEAVGRLTVVYKAHNVSIDARVEEVKLQHLIDTYMGLFIVGKQMFDGLNLSSQLASVVQAYPGFHDTQKFSAQVSSGVIASRASEPDFAQDSLTFGAATQIVEEIVERYGRWQNSECQDLKGMLTKLEHGNSGRVLLKDFYGSALQGNWQFSESVDYLRELGALDETDPHHKSVLIPNYVNAPSSCLGESSIFSVCCINECEALLGHLERQIAAPEASTTYILEIVAKLPSATVAAPRELPQELRSRLVEVASHHGGIVPLHGRLFAQWLHHAYPRECPYPHATGKVNPMTAAAWERERGQSSDADKKELQRFAAKEAPVGHQAILPWTREEELITRNVWKPEPGAEISRSLVLLVVVVSMCIALGRTVSDSLASLRDGRKQSSLHLPYMQKDHVC